MSLELETVFHRRAHARGLVLDAVCRLAAEFRAYRRRRATARALHGLTASELKDIGLVRTVDGYRGLRRDRYGAGYWNV